MKSSLRAESSGICLESRISSCETEALFCCCAGGLFVSGLAWECSDGEEDRGLERRDIRAAEVQRCRNPRGGYAMVSLHKEAEDRDRETTKKKNLNPPKQTKTQRERDTERGAGFQYPFHIRPDKSKVRSPTHTHTHTHTQATWQPHRNQV